MAYSTTNFLRLKKLHDSAHNAGFEPGSWQETCYRILDGLIKQKRAVWFRTPSIRKRRGTDYFQVIKEPMDLGTVKMRLTNGFYTEASAFAAAVRSPSTTPPPTPPHHPAPRRRRQTPPAVRPEVQRALSPDGVGAGGRHGGGVERQRRRPHGHGRRAGYRQGGGRCGGDGGGGNGDGGGGSGQPLPPSSGFDADDAEWGGGAAATAEQPRP